MRNAKNNKYALMVSAALSAGVLLPASNADAWIAVGHWGGGCCYHPCYAGVAGAAIAGMAVGAAIASRPPAVIVAPTVIAPAPEVIVNPPPVYYPPPPVIGSTITILPEGAKSLVVNGTQYYQSGSTWYHPYFGSNGVYYSVVAAP